MKIGIIGYGVVGKATEILLREFYDPKFELAIFDTKIVDSSIQSMERCRYVFLCLPTPSDQNGHCDLSLIKGAHESLIHLQQERGFPLKQILIIRSTVKPGTTAAFTDTTLPTLPVLFMPEFLTESQYWSDAKNPPFLVLGDTDEKTAQMVMDELFSAVQCPKFTVNCTTAELLKYSMNCLFATKVTFANQMYDIAHEIGADWNVIKDIMYLHPWTGSNHLDVFHAGSRGFGGKCLPKDARAIATEFKSRLMGMVIELNEKYRKDQRRP